MKLTPLQNVFKGKNLELPDLEVLKADAEFYELLLMQMQGEIQVKQNFIGNKNVTDANTKHEKFFDLAKTSKAHLVITPEYSCPWLTLKNLLTKGVLPDPGKLWVIGCESITLEGLKELPSLPNIEWIYDQTVLDQTGNFLNPVCYIFQTNTGDGKSKYVVLIQFKSQKSLEERDDLIKGSEAYLISNKSPGSNQLLTLICADVYKLNDEDVAPLIDKPIILVHIQLNPKPRDVQFSMYRKKIFGQAYEKADIICLNWSEDTFSRNGFRGDNSGFWGSAIYTKSTSLNLQTERISKNHAFGLYTTRWTRKTWAYYFHPQETIFQLRTTKVCQRGSQAQLARRTGPEVLNKYIWNGTNWINEKEPKNDGFVEICNTYDLEFNSPCFNNGQLDIVAIERHIVLSTGLANKKEWHNLNKLETFKVSEGEELKRLTCTLDKSQYAWRNECIGNYRVLKNIILKSSSTPFPQRILSLKNNSNMHYSDQRPNINLASKDDKQTATIVYVGNHPNDKHSRKIFDQMSDILGDSEKKRLVVWYLKDNEYIPICPQEDPQIDEDTSENSTSISNDERFI